MVISFVAAAVGAIMYFAITTQGSGFRLSTIGVILMIVGAVGIVFSSVVLAASRKTTSRQTFDREMTDAQGKSSELHEETRRVSSWGLLCVGPRGMF